MGTLTSFMFISLDGCFEGAEKGDIGWHPHDEESSSFAAEMLACRSILLFGRLTYEIMSSYWPTETAMNHDPVVAEGMNRAEKIVFSKSLGTASWNNTKVIGDDIVNRIREMKQTSGKGMTILGSGSIVTQFARHRLIDEFQVMVDPVVIGKGRKIFDGMDELFRLTLTGTKVFRRGSVLLRYRPEIGR